MGVASGCGCKEYIDFLIIITYPYSSCICSFLQQHPYFLFIFKTFFVLAIYECSCIYIYLCPPPTCHVYIIIYIPLPPLLHVMYI